MANYSNPSPDTHVEVLYRQTYNTYGQITALGLTQDNRAMGNGQSTGNQRLNAGTPKGILAGSVVAVAGDGLIGPCAGDATTADMAVGIAVNNALGNPYESSSAVASQKVVYAHGTGTVIRTDIYETVLANGSTLIQYTAGDLMYASQNGLLTNASGLVVNGVSALDTVMGILLVKPTATDPYMVVQLRV